MKNISEFAGPDEPIRASSLDLLVKCPVRSLLMWLGELQDSSGAAADTGSTVHAGVEAFHTFAGGFDEKVEAGLEAMRQARARFPQADETDVRLFYKAYISDPRNSNQEIVRVETQVAISLAPHASDPTGKPIHIRGTLDQIRRINGKLYVMDLKCGSKAGWVYLHTYSLQQSAYVLAANNLALGEPVHPGALIVANGWRRRGIDRRHRRTACFLDAVDD